MYTELFISFIFIWIIGVIILDNLGFDVDTDVEITNHIPLTKRLLWPFYLVLRIGGFIAVNIKALIEAYKYDKSLKK